MASLNEDYEFGTMVEGDVEEVAALKVESFIDKALWCCCSSRAASLASQEKAFRSQDWAWGQIGVVREKASGRIVASLTLKLPSQAGDATFPTFAQHVCGSGEAYVEVVFVDASCRGKGVGGYLLRWAEELARSKGCTRITLEVTRTNRAVGLYKRVGYNVIKTSDCIDAAVTWMLIGAYGTHLMEKPLP